MINLKFDVEDRDYGRLSGKYPNVRYERPSHELDALGIKFKLWKSNMMAGVICLFNCHGVPKKLPGYITHIEENIDEFHNKFHHGVQLTSNELSVVKGPNA